MKNLRIILLLALSIAFAFSNIFPFGAARPASAYSCISLSNNLKFQSSDSAAVSAPVYNAPVYQAAKYSYPALTKYLYLDISDPEVITLKKFLVAEGLLTDQISTTDYFGEMTEVAVKAFQKREGIVSSGTAATTGFGTVGARTRAAINKYSVSSQASTYQPAAYTYTQTQSSGEVSLLQNFLSSAGYLSSAATGYFGNLTLAAVKSFQSANGIDPTGFVGPITKAKIKEISCGGVAVPQTYVPPTSVTQSGNGCVNGAAFNIFTGASCYNNANVSGVLNLSSSISSSNDTSTTIDYSIYDPSNSPSYNLAVSCPSNVTVYYQGSNACGNIKLYQGTQRFSLTAYNNSSDGSRSLRVKLSAISQSGNTVSEDTDTVSISGRSRSIEVTSPSNNQSYVQGDTMNIRWNSSSLSSYVKIALYKNGALYGTIYDYLSNNGSYNWVIPASVIVGGDYKIRITDANDSSIYDDSDGGFSVIQSAYNAKTITSFNFTSPSATGVIDEANKTVKLTVPFSTSLTALVPTIVTAGNSTILPLSGVAQNFTTYKDYVVKAQDGTTQTYRVTVNKAEATSGKAILTFNFANPAATGSVNESAKTISVSFPVGTAVTSLSPTISLSPNARVSPASGVPKSFATPQTYTVTAQNGDTQPYVVTASVAQPFLTLTTPNGGNSFQRGTSMHIVWSQLGVSNIKIELLNGTTKVADIATSQSASAGSFDYTIPLSTTVGTAYKIRITDTASTARTDTSDASFSITENTAPQGFTFSNPASGSNNFVGRPIIFGWTTAGNVSNIGIAAVRGTGASAATTTLVASVANTGAYTWNVPINQTVGNDYALFIYNTANANIFAYSPRLNIVNGTLSVTSPDLNSNNFVGKPLTINWTTSGNVSNVGLSYVKGTATTTLTAGTSNTGTYTWNVPAGQATGNDYSIFVYNTVNGNVFAYSPRFSIVNGGITITNPTLDFEYFTGKTLPISWTSVGYIPNVGLSYVKGTATTSLVASTPNTGAYSWNILSSQPAGNDYSIYVYNTSNGNVYAKSPKFKITVPNITVTAPSNTTLIKGTNMTVTWTATANVSTVKIELLKGTTVVAGINPLSPSVSASAGSASFFLPTTLATGSDYYVKVTDTASTLSDKNNSPFTINSPSVNTSAASDAWEQFLKWFYSN